MKRLNIRINGTIPGYYKEQIVSIAVDEKGTSLDEFWRRRLKDAERDNCCEIVKPRAVARGKAKKEENKK